MDDVGVPLIPLCQAASHRRAKYNMKHSLFILPAVDSDSS